LQKDFWVATVVRLDHTDIVLAHLFYEIDGGKPRIATDGILGRVSVGSIEIVFGHGQNVLPLARAIYNIDAGGGGLHLVAVGESVDLDWIKLRSADHEE